MTEILTIQELAERSKVSEKTVPRAIKAGRLRPAKQGGYSGSRGVWRIAFEDARARFEDCAATHASSSVTRVPRRRRQQTFGVHSQVERPLAHLAWPPTPGGRLYLRTAAAHPQSATT